MQNYPVRASHRANLTAESLERLARAHFGDASVAEGVVIARFGALERLSARGGGRELVIDVTMNPKVPPEVAADTIRRYNQFLEETTGFNSKERAKRLKKATTGPSA